MTLALQWGFWPISVVSKMSPVFLTYVWCSWHVSGVLNKSEEFPWKTCGSPDTPVIFMTCLYYPYTHVVSWTQMCCPLHIWSAPDESVVSLEYLWYLWIVFGVPDPSAEPQTVPGVSNTSFWWPLCNKLDLLVKSQKHIYSIVSGPFLVSQTYFCCP